VTIRSRVPWAVAVLMTCLVLPSCLGKGLKYDAERLQRKCKLTEGTDVTHDQARCIAKVAGLKQGRKCPFEIVELTDELQGPVYDVRESCSGIGIRIHKASGEILGVDFGEAAAP
jgi:hypothetical protein